MDALFRECLAETARLPRELEGSADWRHQRVIYFPIGGSFGRDTWSFRELLGEAGSILAAIRASRAHQRRTVGFPMITRDGAMRLVELEYGDAAALVNAIDQRLCHVFNLANKTLAERGSSPLSEVAVAQTDAAGNVTGLVKQFRYV